MHLEAGIEINVSLEAIDLLFFWSVEFLKISMEKVQILRKWVFGLVYALLYFIHWLKLPTLFFIQFLSQIYNIPHKLLMCTTFFTLLEIDVFFMFYITLSLIHQWIVGSLCLIFFCLFEQ